MAEGYVFGLRIQPVHDSMCCFGWNFNALFGKRHGMFSGLILCQILSSKSDSLSVPLVVRDKRVGI